MTKKDVKAFLNQVRDIIRQENRILEQMQQLEDRQLSITAQLSDMPRGSTPFTTEDYAAEMDILKRQLLLQMRREREAYKQILSVLDHLTGIEREIMIMHYLMLFTWEEIACRVEKSYRWTQKLHGRALEKVLQIMLVHVDD